MSKVGDIPDSARGLMNAPYNERNVDVEFQLESIANFNRETDHGLLIGVCIDYIFRDNPYQREFGYDLIDDFLFKIADGTIKGVKLTGDQKRMIKYTELTVIDYEIVDDVYVRMTFISDENGKKTQGVLPPIYLQDFILNDIMGY